jgi:hypothetical protein
VVLGYEELTEPERAVWNAIEAGALVKLPVGAPTTDDPATGETWGEERQVRAQLLYELLAGVNGPKDVRPRALNLTGARITGILDLEAVTLVCPLSLRRCSLEHPINLREAHAPAVRLLGCHAPALDAEQFQSQRNLELDGFTADEIDLLGAHIGGRLFLNGATLTNPRGRAFLADGLTVDRDMFCDEGFTAKGEVRLVGAHIGGEFVLGGASLTNRDGYALMADKLTVGHDMFCNDGFTAHGKVSLIAAHIVGTLALAGARLTNRHGYALEADKLTVDKSMICNEGFTAQGGVWLVSAHIGGQLNFDGARLTNPDDGALNADGLTVDRDMFCQEGFTAQGEVRLVGGRIGGQLSFDEASVSNPDGDALNADKLTVDTSMFCRDGFTAQGEVNLVAAHIGSNLELDGASLMNSHGPALNASTLRVEQDMICGEGFTAQGEVRLAGGRIGGQLTFEEARFTNPGGMALNLERVQVPSLILRPKMPPAGIVDLTDARVQTCADSQTTWPPDLRLSGFTYGALIATPEVNVTGRLRWLEHDSSGYIPQPYEQLAAAYRAAGRDDDARKVAIAKQRRRRQTLNLSGKLWSSLLRWTVGYGYQTWKAGAWLLLLAGLGWWIFDLAHPAHLLVAKPPGQRPWFHAGLYALDLLLPSPTSATRAPGSLAGGREGPTWSGTWPAGYSSPLC